jgi:hypothetical protein
MLPDFLETGSVLWKWETDREALRDMYSTVIRLEWVCAQTLTIDNPLASRHFWKWQFRREDTQVRSCWDVGTSCAIVK